MLKVQEMEISRLMPWEGNPRVNDHAVDVVSKSIQSFGFNVPILCDQNLTIIAGHTRWKAAKKLGMTTVPMITLEMTDAQRRAFSVADNKTTEIAEWDFPKLRDVLARLQTEDIALKDVGFTDAELRRLLATEERDENDIPAPLAGRRTRTGDVWILGDHRLICGDSRDRGEIERLMAGKQIDHVFGGPPYFNQRVYAQWDEYNDYLADMRSIIGNCRHILKDGGVMVWNVANDCSAHKDIASHHSRLFEEAGFRYLDTIAWFKTKANFAIPRNFHIKSSRCYFPAFQWEPLLVFQKPGAMPKMSREGVTYMLHYQTNVWEVPAIENQVKRCGHPAVCPVEIPYRSLQAYSVEGGTVFEPFGGSGTTLIAAEKARRRAFVMERCPEYCDVIVKRWEELTGHQAQHLPAKTGAAKA